MNRKERHRAQIPQGCQQPLLVVLFTMWNLRKKYRSDISKANALHSSQIKTYKLALVSMDKMSL